MKKLIALTALLGIWVLTTAQNVGIGTNTPKATLNISEGKTVLFGLDTSSPGSKLIWYSTKSAIRAGYSSAGWDFANVGIYSAAIGFGTLADGQASFAAGQFTHAKGFAATSLGYNTIAEGSGATALNYSSYAKGDFSTAMGNSTVTSARFATVVGVYNKDVPNALFIVGNGHNGIDFTTPSNAFIVMLDGKTGIATSSPLAQLEVKSSTYDAYAGIMLSNTNAGSKPLTINQGTMGKLNFTNPGVIDLVTMDFNNNRVGINATFPSHLLQLGNDDAYKPSTSTWGVISDKRVKENIQPFTDGWNVLKYLNPVWFEYNGAAGTHKGEKAIGTIAQELKMIAPYMVNETNIQDEQSNSTAYLGVNYHAMFFLLANALKDQNKLIEQLQQEVTALKAKAH